MKARRVLTIAQLVWLEMLRRRDAYVLGVLLGALLLGLASVDIFGLGRVSGYVKDIGLLACWVLGWILAVQTSTRQLPQELSRGTLYSLLAKPLTRLELLAGKWLGAWGATALSVVCFYALLGAVLALRGGAFQAVTLIQAVVLHLSALGIIAAAGLALSTRLTSEAAATLTYVLTGGAFLVLPQAPSILLQMRGALAAAWLTLYYGLPHFELFDLRRRLIHDWGPASWSTVGLVLIYGAACTAFLLLLAWLSYRRRRFARSEML